MTTRWSTALFFVGVSASGFWLVWATRHLGRMPTGSNARENLAWGFGFRAKLGGWALGVGGLLGAIGYIFFKT